MFSNMADDEEVQEVEELSLPARPAVDKASLYKPDHLKSEVWEYFRLSSDKEYKSKAFCVKCGDEPFNYKYGNTSVLSKHLFRKHDINTKPKKTDNQPSLFALFDKKKLFGLNDKRALEISVRICLMISRDLQPFSVIENEGFRTLIEHLEPRYKIPSRKFLTSNILPRIYSTCKQKLFEKLDCTKELNISLTTDAWTSSKPESYITVTIHILNDKWQMESYVLCTDPFCLAHTAGNLAAHLTETINNWSLTSPKDTGLFVTTDNASNVVKGKCSAQLFFSFLPVNFR